MQPISTQRQHGAASAGMPSTAQGAAAPPRINAYPTPEQAYAFVESYRHRRAELTQDRLAFFDFFVAICQEITVADASLVFGVDGYYAQAYRRCLAMQGPEATFALIALGRETHAASQARQSDALNARVSDRYAPATYGMDVGAPAPNSPCCLPRMNPTYANHAQAFPRGGPGPMNTMACFAPIGAQPNSGDGAAAAHLPARAKVSSDPANTIPTHNRANDRSPRLHQDLVTNHYDGAESRIPVALDSFIVPDESEPPLSEQAQPTVAQRTYFAHYARAHMQRVSTPSKQRVLALTLICEGMQPQHAHRQTSVDPRATGHDMYALARTGPKAVLEQFFATELTHAPAKRRVKAATNTHDAQASQLVELEAFAAHLCPEPPLSHNEVATPQQRAYFAAYARAHLTQVPALIQSRVHALILICEGMSHARAAKLTTVFSSTTSGYIQKLARCGPKHMLQHFFSKKVAYWALRQAARRPLKNLAADKPQICNASPHANQPAPPSPSTTNPNNLVELSSPPYQLIPRIDNTQSAALALTESEKLDV
jgi:hypothetical protein